MSEQDGADVIEGRCRRAQDVQYHARQNSASEESAELPDASAEAGLARVGCDPAAIGCVNSEAE